MSAIAKLQTLRIDPRSDLGPGVDLEPTLLRVHTDDGAVGLGETYPIGGMETAAIHGPIADRVLGRDPQDVEAIRDDLLTQFNFYGHAGAEARATSALDVALWDLKGRLAGEPVYNLLGGRSREAAPVYNTCFPREDFLTRPAELAESLLDDGIGAMKIWPFDDYADETRGQRIASRDLDAALDPVRAIREAVGDRMEIAIELHGRWSLTPARKIAGALAEYDPLWVEDAIRKGNVDAYRRLADGLDVPLTLSERLVGRYEYQQLLRTGAVDVVMLDVEWTGGLTEARAVASMAEAHHLPVAPHNAGGPVLHAASAHLATAIPNLYVLESVRGWYDGWHERVLDRPLPVEDGELAAPDGPGLGVALDDAVLDHPDVTVRETER